MVPVEALPIRSFIRMANLIWPLSKYAIKRVDGNHYSLTKSHLIDSTFKEVYVYDKDFILQEVTLYLGGDTLVFSHE